jgi:Sulfatase-modifying factor enzyme 1
MVNDLTLEKWDSMTPPERGTFAKRLAQELPSAFTFRSIRLHTMGEQSHYIAEYELGAALFALIPGGTITLGYDSNRQWEPTPEELESWRDTAQEYGIDSTIQEHVAEATLRPRVVVLRSMLIETAGEEVGWEPLSAEDPEVKEIVRQHFPKKGSRSNQVNVQRGNTSLRVQRAPDGTITARRAEARAHAELAAQLASAGFRFPTSDEWEYACGCGAATLFRWGDHVPCDRYPTDISPEEAAWRRQWALSAGKLEYPADGFASDWDLHRRPNAFGIHIASNPYKYELVAEPQITRGGDGGCTICGGAGFFVGWLTLATAYFEEHACKHDPEEVVSPGYTIGRRVLLLN